MTQELLTRLFNLMNDVTSKVQAVTFTRWGKASCLVFSGDKIIQLSQTPADPFLGIGVQPVWTCGQSQKHRS